MTLKYTILDYILAAFFLHFFVLVLLFNFSSKVNTLNGGADKIDIQIVERQKTPATVILPQSPPKYAKPRSRVNTNEKGPKVGQQKSQKDPGLTELPPVKLETYAAQIKAIVDPVWYQSIQSRLSSIPAGTQTNVLLFLDKYGNVLNVKVIDSSGIREIDQIAINTFKQIGKLPAPPERLVKEGIIWEFGLGERI